MIILAALALSSVLGAGTEIPVDVTSCSSQITSAGQIGASPILTIDFTNTSSKMISSIVFGISDGHNAEVPLTDAGTFNGGASVRHTFNSPVSSVSGTKCVVRSVTFSDGGRWVAGADTPR
ncbi:MAG: hypothetical protein JO322_07195 [Candidatus Eremiobacteraeota bacterium]|nr:hypothetical protein [Candidatus Eremiobacteraeota bacterium]